MDVGHAHELLQFTDLRVRLYKSVFPAFESPTHLPLLFSLDVQGKVNCGAILESPRMSRRSLWESHNARPSGDDRSVSRSAIFGVVRRTLFVLHMCGLFHYTCLTDFSFAYI